MKGKKKSFNKASNMGILMKTKRILCSSTYISKRYISTRLPNAVALYTLLSIAACTRAIRVIRVYMPFILLKVFASAREDNNSKIETLTRSVCLSAKNNGAHT